MSVWFDCESVWDGFLDTLPRVVDVSELIPGPRERVFEAITDPLLHVGWVHGMREVRWLTPPPYGPGTERRVIHAQMRLDVRVAAYERPRRIGFYAVRSGQPLLRQFMEEFVLTEESYGTRVRWRIGWRLALPLRPIEPMTVRVGQRLFGSILAGLRQHFNATAG